MKKILLSLCGITALTLIILILINTSRDKLHLSGPIGINMRFPEIVSDTTFHYFSGSSFVSYDLTTQKSKPLTPIYFLPNVTEVKWSSNRIAFQANNYSDADQLNSTLTKLSLATDKSYWWSVDLKSGLISIIGNDINQYNVTGLVFLPNSDLYFTELTTIDLDKPNQKLSIYTPNKPPAQELFISTTNNGNRSVTPLDDAHALVSANSTSLSFIGSRKDSLSLESLDFKTKKISSLYDGVSVDFSSNSLGTSFFVTHPTNNQTEVGESIGTIFVLLNGQAIKLNDSFTGSTSWQQNGSNRCVYNSKTGSLSYVINEVNHSYTFSKKDLGSENPSSFRLIGVSSDSVFILGKGNTLYQASAKDHSYLPLQDTSKLQKTIYSPDYYRVYEASNSQYDFFIQKQPYSKTANSIVSSITAQGIDPFQMNIQFVQYTTTPH